MPQVYLMCGLPFSGKSTLSKAISQYLGIPRISFDETWLEIEETQGVVPGADAVEQWRYVNRVCEEKIVDNLREGRGVVYDNLGDRAEHREHINNLAGENGAEAKVIYVEVSKEEVSRRREANLITQERPQVTDDNFFRALDNFEPPTESEDVLVCKPNQEIESWLEKEFGQLGYNRERN